MIYRIIAEDERYYWDKEEEQYIQVSGSLRGAYMAGFTDFQGLPMPKARVHPRARFWFTEAGWKKYGKFVIADAMRSGRVYRLLRRKNPPRSAIVYQDKWQIALLPVK